MTQKSHSRSVIIGVQQTETTEPAMTQEYYTTKISKHLTKEKERR